MKIKVKLIILIVAIYCVVIECKWDVILKINNSYTFNLKQMFYILTFLYCRFVPRAYIKIKKYSRFLNSYMVGLLFFSVIELFYTILFRNESFATAWQYLFWYYTKFLFVYVLLYLFENFSLKKICNIIAIIGILSIAYQAFVAILYNQNGTIINTELLTNKNWIRNGFIRISSTCTTWFIMIYEFYKGLNEKRKFSKIIHIAYSLACFLFLFFINQSRSLYVAGLLALVVTYLFQKRRNIRQFVVIIGLCVGIIVFFNSAIFNEFMNSFAKNSTDDTLSSRIEYLGLMYQSFREHPLFGFGFIGTTTLIGAKTFYFIDYGLLGDFLQLGLFALYIYLGTIVILVKNILYRWRNGGEFFNLYMGILAFMLAGAIGFTVLGNERNFILPLIWALSEYTRNIEDNNNENSISKYSLFSKC